jgi:hypothetical protein
MGVSGQHHAPASLYPRGKDPSTHCTEGWVGHKAGMDAEARRKILCLCRGSNPGHPVRSQDTKLTELPRLLISMFRMFKKNLSFFFVYWRCQSSRWLGAHMDPVSEWMHHMDEKLCYWSFGDPYCLQLRGKMMTTQWPLSISIIQTNYIYIIP